MAKKLSNTTDEADVESLGLYLRKSRIAKDLEIPDIVKSTKISQINVTAIEEDDFNALPSAAFTRGLYTIYAKALDLNPEEVLARLHKECLDKQKQGTVSTPSCLIREVSAMAERPSPPPTMMFGLTLLFFLLLAGIGCWYYSINPATFLSEKLRSLQSTSQQGPAYQPSGSYLPADTRQRYALSGFFPDDTQVKITIDNNDSKLYDISGGRQLMWTAAKTMQITLPADTNANLSVNGVQLSLPEPNDELIVISVPQHMGE